MLCPTLIEATVAAFRLLLFFLLGNINSEAVLLLVMSSISSMFMDRLLFRVVVVGRTRERLYNVASADDRLLGDINLLLVLVLLLPL